MATCPASMRSIAIWSFLSIWSFAPLWGKGREAMAKRIAILQELGYRVALIFMACKSKHLQTSDWKKLRLETISWWWLKTMSLKKQFKNKRILGTARSHGAGLGCDVNTLIMLRSWLYDDVNTLIMLRSWLSYVDVNTLTMLHSWLSNVDANTIMTLRSWLSYVDVNTLMTLCSCFLCWC